MDYEEKYKEALERAKEKEVDLEHLEQEVRDFCYKFDDRKDKWYDMTPHDKNIMVNPTWSNFAMQLAKHFFELGLNASSPLTWEDIAQINSITNTLLNECKDEIFRVYLILNQRKGIVGIVVLCVMKGNQSL